MKRGQVRGWSRKSAQRLRREFFKVEGDNLGDGGVALTLTVRDLPPSAEAWTRTRRNFLDRLRRDGLVRAQWLTEWQRRGVPHLHGCAWLDDPSGASQAVVGHWLEVAGQWGAEARGQHVRSIDGLAGWLKYQAKHSGRGVHHYQRAQVPDAWTSTGRLWGFVGDWPRREEQLEVPELTFHRYRRAVRAYLVAEARRSPTPLEAVHWRGLLRDPDRDRSRVRGVSAFIPEAASRRLLTWAHGSLPVAPV